MSYRVKNPGYAVVVDPEGPAKEFDTFTCHHCQRVVLVGAGKDPSDLGGFCRVCMHNICGPCADRGNCAPFERRLEEVERRSSFLRSVGVDE